MGAGGPGLGEVVGGTRACVGALSEDLELAPGAEVEVVVVSAEEHGQIVVRVVEQSPS